MDADYSDDSDTELPPVHKQVQEVEDASLLLKACDVGDLKTVKDEINKGEDVEKGFICCMGKDDDRQEGVTPFGRAASQGRTKVVKYLLDQGLVNINGNPRNPNTKTVPLIFAAMCNQVETMELLISRGADVHAVDHLHYCPLVMACIYGNLEAVECLLKHGADPNFSAGDYDNSDTRLTAVFSREDMPPSEIQNTLPLLKCLVKAGVNLKEGRRDFGETILHLLCSYNEYENYTKNNGRKIILDSVKYLIQQESSLVHASDWNGDTPLHSAFQFGQVKAASVLIRAGASLNVYNNEGNTPFHDASDCKKPKVWWDDCISHGVDIHATDSEGKNFLHRVLCGDPWSHNDKVNKACFFKALGQDFHLYIEDIATQKALKKIICVSYINQRNHDKHDNTILVELIQDGRIISRNARMYPNKVPNLHLKCSHKIAFNTWKFLTPECIYMLCVAGFRTEINYQSRLPQNQTFFTSKQGQRVKDIIDEFETTVMSLAELSRLTVRNCLGSGLKYLGKVEKLSHLIPKHIQEYLYIPERELEVDFQYSDDEESDDDDDDDDDTNDSDDSDGDSDDSNVDSSDDSDDDDSDDDYSDDDSDGDSNGDNNADNNDTIDDS